ncbi:MAG: acyl-CoA carboxylase epsilon subunit [Sporichthyaceae bacterium]
MAAEETPARPVLRIVRGTPDEYELAALLAVVAARAGASAPAAPPKVPSAWTDRSRLVRRHLYPGPGAWRASAWRT